MTAGPDPHVLRPDHAPTPFTAAEIRGNCRPGRSVRILVEPPEGEPFLRVTRFLSCDEDSAEQEQRNLALDGQPLAPAELHRPAWLDLQAHASFPRDATTIGREAIDLPMGRLECLRYTVVDGARSTTFWFDTARPGMPVKVVANERGRTVSTTTMVADEVLPVRT